MGAVGKSFLLILTTLVVCGQTNRAVPQMTEIMDEMFQNYDRRIRPFYGGPAVQVAMNASVLDVYDIDDLRHEFTVTLYLRHHWREPLLNYQHLIDNSDNFHRVMLDAEHTQKLWIPDTFILNQRKGTTDSSDFFSQVTIVYPNGEIRRSTRITATVSCIMDLSHFPFDSQTCSVDFGSYAHAAPEIVYKWTGRSLTSGSGADVTSYTTNSRFYISKIEAKDQIFSFHGVNVSRFSMELTFSRECGRYLKDVFFPSVVLTLVSLMTLWMHQQQFRLLVSCFIVCIYTVFISMSGGSLTRVSYQTAMDAYLFVSFTITLIVTLTNFVLTHSQSGSCSKSAQFEGMEMHQIRSSRHADEHNGFKVGRPTVLTKFQDIIFGVFSKLRLILPMIFLAFNFAYWVVILAISKSHSRSSDQDDEAFHEY